MKSYIFILFIAASIFSGCNRDVCDQVICRNDGICEEGACNCAPGFKGLECQEQKTPSQITLSKILINSFPEPGNWDPNTPTDGSLSSDPDVYIKLYQNGKIIYDGSTLVSSDFQSGNYLSLNLTIHKEGFDDPITFEVYDYDFGGRTDELIMTGKLSELYSSENKFPDTLTLISQQTIDTEVSLEYGW